MKIVITGACGFIGFHTAKRLLSLGHEILGIDSLNDYYDPDLKRARLEILLSQGMQFEKADISKKSTYESISKFSPEVFLHLAAQAGVRYASENPRAYLESNLIGFFEVLEWIKEHPSVPLVYASSSSVYGNSSSAPFEESEKADEPESFYAATKRSNELMAISYHKTFGIKARGLRFFTVFGPFGRPDMAYFSFTKAISEDLPINVYHEGQAKRDFTYIDDIVDGILGAISDTAACAVYNLGHNQPYTTLELIGIIEDFLKKKAKIQYVEGPKGDVDLTFASIEKSGKALNFEPKKTLKEGMGEFLAWYQEYFVNLPSNS